MKEKGTKMGSKWEVNGWRYDENMNVGWDVTLYMGESFLKAAWAFFRNRNQYGCVKLERRG